MGYIGAHGVAALHRHKYSVSALLGYIYSPQLDSPPPRWVHFAHGLLLFLYQTFDAVDGKQARRTNSSSPLGSCLTMDAMRLLVHLNHWLLGALLCVEEVLFGSG
ncbi:hypothetical protein K1719_027972 [Acacia pycnantha]|nr:hypothetical protein K1719_027972 [Acacia pycnantha]